MTDKLPETLAREQEEKSLSDRADEIILQPAYTDQDIFDLCKIKREMTKLYAQVNDIATCAEHNFEILEHTLPSEWGVTKEKAKARLNAEEKYGQFRNLKAAAQGIMAKIKAIESICIQYNVTQKGMRDASMTQWDL